MGVEATKKALDSYMKKQAKKATPRKKREKRKAPEKEVEKQVKEWLEKQGFFFTIIEAKASTAYKNYGQRAVPAGFPDIVGSSPNGVATYIELKAPANKNGLSRGQYEFLKAACKKGAFAVHTWSIDNLAYKYGIFLSGGDMLQFLPKKFEDDGPLFANL